MMLCTPIAAQHLFRMLRSVIDLQVRMFSVCFNHDEISHDLLPDCCSIH